MKVPVGEGNLRVTAIAGPAVNTKQLAGALLKLAKRQIGDDKEEAA
jgi:hypothetical protein